MKFPFIKFILFKTCDYRCEYCRETFSEDKRKGEIKNSNIQTICKNIDDMYTKFKKQIDVPVDDGIDLTISGGETFLVDWTKYLKYIKTPIRKLTMISKFTCNKKLYKKISKYCYTKRIPLRLIASFHASQTDIYSFFERVSKIYEFIQNKNNKFLTRVLKIPKQSLSIQPVISKASIDIVRELYNLVLQS
jgi:organic radical activating enzyme